MSQYFPGFQQPMYQQPTYPTQLPQMQRQMPVMQQPVPQQMPMEQSIMTLVTSKEQAMVAQIPFDGKTYFFHNTANDEVYSKRFDNTTGTAPLIIYGRMDRAQEAYAPLSMVQQLAQQLQDMQGAIQGMTSKGKRATAPREEETA